MLTHFGNNKDRLKMTFSFKANASVTFQPTDDGAIHPHAVLVQPQSAGG